MATVFVPDHSDPNAVILPVIYLKQRRLLAQICRCESGRVCPLCPGISEVDLFGYREGIIYLDAEVSDGAFDFGVAEQELHGS